MVVVDCLTLWISNMLISKLSVDDILARVDRLVDELADRSGPDLLPDAAALVVRLRRAWLTSS